MVVKGPVGGALPRDATLESPAPGNHTHETPAGKRLHLRMTGSTNDGTPAHASDALLREGESEKESVRKHTACAK